MEHSIYSLLSKISSKKKKFNKLFSTDDIIENTRTELNRMILDVNRNAERNITLIEAKINDLKALIAKADESIFRILGRHGSRASSSTDANTALGAGIPAICIGGAVGGRCHTREEWLDPESLLDGSRIILDFLSHYFA